MLPKKSSAHDLLRDSRAIVQQRLHPRVQLLLSNRGVPWSSAALREAKNRRLRSADAAEPVLNEPRVEPWEDATVRRFCPARR